MGNLVEYALKLDPRLPEGHPFPPVSLTPEGRMAVALNVRNDDVKLHVELEASPDLSFETLQSVPLSLEQPDIGGGLKRLHFTDSVATGDVPARFFRWVFNRDP
jgi:hypothetical protein